MSSQISPASGFEKLRRIESSKVFQGAVITIIILSALTIGAKTYDLPPLVEKSLIVMDNAITLFFLVEILFRFGVCANKKRFLFDGWNLFDTLVVIGSLIPLDNSEAVLLGRLLRVFRVLRLVSVVPELRFLINSLLKAIPRMGYIALLMFIIFYIYAAMGSMFFSSVDETLWGDVAISMLTLFRVMTFEDWTDVMYETMAVYPLSWTYFLIFLSITAFALLNMIIGIVVNVMEQERAAVRKEQGSASLDTLEADIKELKTLLRSLENVQTVNNSANSGAQTARSEP